MGIIISFPFDLKVIPPIILPNADKYKLVTFNRLKPFRFHKNKQKVLDSIAEILNE